MCNVHAGLHDLIGKDINPHLYSRGGVEGLVPPHPTP